MYGDNVAQMIFGGTSISLPSLHLGFHSRASFDTGSESIQDPKGSKRKDAPRKLRTKSPLESHSMKSKATSTSTKGQRPRSRQRQSSTRNTSDCRMLRINTTIMFTRHIGDEEMFTVAQPFTASNFISPSTSNVVFNYEVGSAMALATGVFQYGLNDPFQALMSPPQSAIPGWMSSATQPIPQPVVASHVAHIHAPRSGLAYQTDGSSIRPVFRHGNAHQ
ncbi:Hypothetical predicted protein [Olea europaea subsp. europaea]|uniref:Uncharacterized protein n=1 Tax=Olea europaea subsp. europaea TaxID=158383 RepID=A0A8S0Q1H9_OLEEU|nr:Hypothetical predicted protein [Olea europaea subsp. europaea]